MQRFRKLKEIVMSFITRKFFLFLIGIGVACHYLSAERFEFGECSAKGRREANEDTHLAYCNNGLGVFGVFDGHGGVDCANYIVEHDRIAHKIEAHGLDDIQASLQATFLELDDEYCALTLTKKPDHLQPVLTERQKKFGMVPRSYDDSGSTAAVVVINGDDLYAANAGDARIVIAHENRNAERLSRDHKPGDVEERARIEALGGSVTKVGSIWRVQGGQSCSRSIGDKFYKPYVTAQPFIVQTIIDPRDRFVIIGCDGLWDVMSDQEAVDFVEEWLEQNGLTPATITKAQAEAVTKALVAKALQHPDQHDNVTVQLIFFH